MEELQDVRVEHIVLFDTMGVEVLQTVAEMVGHAVELRVAGGNLKQQVIELNAVAADVAVMILLDIVYQEVEIPGLKRCVDVAGLFIFAIVCCLWLQRYDAGRRPSGHNCDPRALKFHKALGSMLLSKCDLKPLFLARMRFFFVNFVANYPSAEGTTHEYQRIIR
jgi:hypothetical protein